MEPAQILKWVKWDLTSLFCPSTLEFKMPVQIMILQFSGAFRENKRRQKNIYSLVDHISQVKEEIPKDGAV